MNKKEKTTLITLILIFLSLLSAFIVTLFFYHKYFFINTANWESLYLQDERHYYEDGYQFAMKMSYPESWSLRNPPESLNYNHDLTISTSEPGVSVSLHAAGPLRSDNCEFYRKFEENVISCEIEQKEYYKIVTVNYVTRGVNFYVKGVFLKNRTYKFVGKYKTSKGLRLLKKVAETFTGDRLPI